MTNLAKWYILLETTENNLPELLKEVTNLKTFCYIQLKSKTTLKEETP